MAEEYQQTVIEDTRSHSTQLIVAAIDFGTTYSGYAFSFRHDFENNPLKIQSNQWTAEGQGLISWKTPTTVLLAPNGSFHSFGYEAEEKYYELAETEKHGDWYYFKRFKMLLHGKTTIQRNTTIDDVTGKPMSAMLIFAIAIDYLRRHLLDLIEKRGIGVENEDINWTLTVPAIWNEPAKQFMREAAIEGGIPSNQLNLALEPEAASIYCKTIPLHRNQDQLGPFLPETVYMVLDCGGGTVDITVHKVSRDGTLKELHRASGGAWGGTKVDISYLALFERMFGPDAMVSFQQHCRIDHLELLRDFEIKKRTINDETTKVTIKMSAGLSEHIKDTLNKTPKEVIAESSLADHVNLRRDRMTISGDVIKELFSSSINSIIAHVKKVLSGSRIECVDKILMVGGFSESPMVRKAIKDAFPDVDVVAPDEPGMAVLKGAVIFGHRPGAISSRIVPYTYGVSVTTDFDETLHPAQNKEEIDQRAFCRNVFSKFITVDDTIGANQVISKTYEVRNRDAPIMIEIMASALNNPVVTNIGCTRLGTVVVKCPIGGWRSNARLVVEFRFGGPEFSVRAVEENTQVEQEAKFDFLQ